ncbi:hypothetical protein DVA76_18980, partial [Acinetobacter baumannii]
MTCALYQHQDDPTSMSSFLILYNKHCAHLRIFEMVEQTGIDQIDKKKKCVCCVIYVVFMAA